MAEIIWTKLAVNQLERAVKYIREEQGRFYAELVLNKILNSAGHLKSFPKSGATEPLLKHKKLSIDMLWFGAIRLFTK